MDTCGRPHVLVLDVHGAGYMKSIQSALLEIGGNCAHIMVVQSAEHILCAVDTGKNGNLSFGRLFDFLDDQTGKTHPVLEIAAELIDTLVGPGRQEGVDQIAVRHMDLNGIGTRLHGALCGLAVALDQLINLLCGDFHRDISSVRGSDRRSGLNGSARVLRVSFRTCVLQLDGDLCTFSMTCIDDFFEAFDGRIIVQAGLSGTALCALVDNGRLKGDQAETALCPCAVICCGLVAHGAVSIGKVIAHRRNNKAVLDNHGTNLNRRKHFYKFHSVTSLLVNHLKISGVHKPVY